MNVEQYILDYINVLRMPEAQPPPPEVAAFNEKYIETCRKRAEAEYKEHGRWFYCEDKKEFGGNIRWDECVTYRIYWQLYTRYGSLDKIPNYSEENHRKAIKFWQSWQQEDGSWRNIFTGKGGRWSSYSTTDQTMKGMMRLIGRLGVENMPCRHVRADTIIENQGEMREGEVSVKRNTAEMMVQCLLESPYRAEELLKALDGHSKVIMEGDPSRSHMTGDYTAYILMIFGPYLNWKGYEGTSPRTPFETGVAYDYRVEVGPFGNCANVIKKRPEELLWHEDFSYARYGLRARNTAHEQRRVTDIVPASDEGWTTSTDDQGRTVLTRTLTLNKTLPEKPYLKIKWSGGDIEILLNDVPVKKKLGGLADFGAVHIPDEARKTLKPGENTLVIRSTGKTKALAVSAGLINW